MNYKEITLMINHEVEPFIADILNEVGANGVVIEDSLELVKGRIETYGEIYELNPDDYPESDVRVKVYFSELDYSDAIINEIKEKINGLQDVEVTRLEITTDEVQEEDWANEWKNHFHAFKASERFVVVPSWENYEKQNDDEFIIKLDPGMAFGTGDHATTSMCLKLIEKYVQPNQSVIDVGTGSGILSIAAHQLGAAPIKALDLDSVAVRVAVDNFEKNDCADAIQAEPGNLLKGESEKRDVIFANILAHIVDLMIDDSFALLNDNGLLITSGIILEKEEMIVEHLERVGYKIEEITRENGWIAIAARKEA
ncbi:50S ribosomal protein L11 methyltransferase [Macrococcus epidermidis]|uniref:50S ribosomal protein L11 methyltransferase n=1 Tax=Macrococcus epidermidis TaxID=1902580 RepID=UPI001EF39DEA|nr:50S ribosomal protein L11 methyltransferase [Macrococcus epidermidis]MCG7420113.1 50S ribosomal protein L11 methyltransferase [Macrococcus epidermidis]UTH15348.1 50S ribosomal protein L11 methyltransferase [Macrococcus epidermidis]